MATWMKNGWQYDCMPWVTTYYHPEKRVAIMVFWFRIRFACFNEKDGKTFENMLISPNYQFLEAFMLLHGDSKRSI